MEDTVRMRFNSSATISQVILATGEIKKLIEMLCLLNNFAKIYCLEKRVELPALVHLLEDSWKALWLVRSLPKEKCYRLNDIKARKEFLLINLYFLIKSKRSYKSSSWRITPSKRIISSQSSPKTLSYSYPWFLINLIIFLFYLSST